MSPAKAIGTIVNGISCVGENIHSSTENHPSRNDANGPIRAADTNILDLDQDSFRKMSKIAIGIRKSR